MKRNELLLIQAEFKKIRNFASDKKAFTQCPFLTYRNLADFRMESGFYTRDGQQVRLSRIFISNLTLTKGSQWHGKNCGK